MYSAHDIECVTHTLFVIYNSPTSSANCKLNYDCIFTCVSGGLFFRGTAGCICHKYLKVPRQPGQKRVCKQNNNDFVEMLNFLSVQKKYS